MQDRYCIEALGISYTYPEGTEALHCIDLRVKSGEFVAVLASNGSGKTTLIKILMGLLKPRTGKISVENRCLGSIPASELYQKIGLVFQNPDDQLFAATVAEDVAFGPRNLGLPEHEITRRVDQALDAVGASALRSRAIHHLSFGEKKRVCLAGVLAMKPRILILDEPTQGLDPAGEMVMLQLLRRLNGLGSTIVMATHSVDMLPLFVDRIAVLKQGRLLCEGPVREVFCDHEMITRASLRLPYVSGLIFDMKRYDGVPIDGLPLTVGEARKRLLELIPEELILAKGRAS